MNKSQLIDALAARYEGNRKTAQAALENVLDTIMREVARGEKVAITGFGSFEKRIRPARMVRNPRTGESIKAKKTAVPKFNPGAELKAVVSGAKKLQKLTVTTAAGTAKAAAGRATKKSTPSKTAAAKTTAAKKSAPAKKTAAKSTPAKKTTTKSTAAKKSAPAKKTAAKSSAAKKSAPAKKSSTAKKSTTKKATAKKS